MKQHTLVSAVFGLCALARSASAAAQEQPTLGRDHFEATMGFMTGGANFSQADFLGGTPVLALRSAPYDSLKTFGLRYELRMVVQHVRMMAGVDLPFASVGAASAQREGEHTVAPNGISLVVGRFGIGAEVPLGQNLAPFLDLVGSIHHAEASVLVDARAESHESLAFGFSVRAGLRAELRRWFFVTASGEVGVTGPSVWSADLSTGVRVP